MPQARDAQGKGGGTGSRCGRSGFSSSRCFNTKASICMGRVVEIGWFCSVRHLYCAESVLERVTCPNAKSDIKPNDKPNALMLTIRLDLDQVLDRNHVLDIDQVLNLEPQIGTFTLTLSLTITLPLPAPSPGSLVFGKLNA